MDEEIARRNHFESHEPTNRSKIIKDGFNTLPSSSPPPPITHNRDGNHFPRLSSSTTEAPAINLDPFFDEKQRHGCVPISLDFCRHLAYNFTFYPNLLGHRGVREVDRFNEAAK